MATEKQRRERRRVNLVDSAAVELLKLIADRDANLASGTFGVLLVMDRGVHRHIRLYQEQTIDTAAPAAI